MLKAILTLYLNYLTFLHPVIRGAKLCNEVEPDPRQVTNIMLALVFSILMELADTIFLSSLIATRTVYTFARIVLCLYFSHAKFLGALRIYERLFATLIEKYTPMIDALVLQHIEAMREWGFIKYSTTIGVSFVRAAAEILDIAQRLLASSSDTKVQPARLERRLSQEREESDPEKETGRPMRLGTPPLRPVTPSRAPVAEAASVGTATVPPAVPTSRPGQSSPQRLHVSRVTPPPPVPRVRDHQTSPARRSPRRQVPLPPREEAYDSALDSASADALSNEDIDDGFARHGVVRRDRSARESPTSKPAIKKFSRMSSYSSSFESTSDHRH